VVRPGVTLALAPLALPFVEPQGGQQRQGGGVGIVQRFMLLNDSATIAVEVPIYLTPEDFAYFRAHGFTFPFGDQPITGHIDFVQLRSGFLHILDDKPDAAKETHAVTQLTIYAMALSRRTRDSREGLQMRLVRRARRLRISPPPRDLSQASRAVRPIKKLASHLRASLPF
jgi:hypothetical protein